jgi:putative hydrolase of the HAD superfamily
MTAAAPGGRGEGTGADLRGVDTWLFDLDNTLYPAEAGVLALVEARILDYFVDLTGLSAADAWSLQKRYLNEHGSAVPGLIEHHQVDPHAFLADVHDVPLDALEPDEALRRALTRLPGRRLVFTNGSARHAERVLDKLGVADAFDEVFHAEAANLVAKPDPRAFEALIRTHKVTPQTTAFFEDRAVNLRPAAALGMTTVLVGPHAAASTEAFVQHRTAALAPFLNAARVKESPQ